MEDRLTMSRQGKAALTTLALILAISASWWALALWPMDAATPAWLARTRLVCFGAALDGLPNAGGWLLLVGQPIGMLAILLAVWGSEVREGVRGLTANVAGQLVAGVTLAAVAGGIGYAVFLVREARAQPFYSSPAAGLARQLTRVHDAPPRMDATLTDQAGRAVTLDQFRGRPVLVTFAYAHCATVCPLTVSDVLLARDRLGARAPAVLILTLDPWRDTPSRLPAIATQWGLTGDAHVLSGEAERVERALNAWRVPRVRNERTGDLSHPSIVYVIGADGRITYVVSGNAEQIEAAVRAL
jgi:protein SCO1/2